MNINNYVFINGDKTKAYFVLDSIEKEVLIFEDIEYASGITVQVPKLTDDWEIANSDEIFNLK